VDLGI